MVCQPTVRKLLMDIEGGIFSRFKASIQSWMDLTNNAVLDQDKMWVT